MGLSRSFFHGHKVAVEAVGIVSALKAGRVKGDEAMPAMPIHLDLETTFSFLDPSPVPEHWPELGLTAVLHCKGREARQTENIIAFG